MYHASLYLAPGKKSPQLCPGTETLVLSGYVLEVFKPYFSLDLYYLSSLGDYSPVRRFKKGKVI